MAVRAQSVRSPPLASEHVTVKDVWVAVAMTGDDLVVELLLRLKMRNGSVVSDNPAVILPPLRWGIRQRRSRSSRSGGGCGGVLVSLKKEVDSVRASPKTPIFWSGGSIFFAVKKFWPCSIVFNFRVSSDPIKKLCSKSMVANPCDPIKKLCCKSMVANPCVLISSFKERQVLASCLIHLGEAPFTVQPPNLTTDRRSVSVLTKLSQESVELVYLRLNQVWVWPIFVSIQVCLGLENFVGLKPLCPTKIKILWVWSISFWTWFFIDM
ncbi:unnamed protein product [Arabidopsis halleri]